MRRKNHWLRPGKRPPRHHHRRLSRLRRHLPKVAAAVVTIGVSFTTASNLIPWHEHEPGLLPSVAIFSYIGPQPIHEPHIGEGSASPDAVLMATLTATTAGENGGGTAIASLTADAIIAARFEDSFTLDAVIGA